MLPEPVMAQAERPAGHLLDAGTWRTGIAALALAWIALAALAAREWGEMFHQYWNIDTYNHILLIPPIIAWLVAQRADELCKLEPRAWWPGLALLALAMSVWLGGRMSGVNLVAHAGAVASLQAAVLAILGPRVAAILLLPLGFACFLVPFGDEIIPPLQAITAKIAIALTHFSGIQATIDGIHIDTPVGLFIVAEACSGVKFLIAMVALGVLVCFTAFERWTRRAAFLGACIVVPVIANGMRAWGTIYIAQFQGVEFAAGFDHIFYGWIFFAIVVALVLGAFWRLFEREPEEAGYSVSELDELPFLARVEKTGENSIAVLAALVALVVAFALTAIVAPQPIG